MKRNGKLELVFVGRDLQELYDWLHDNLRKDYFEFINFYGFISLPSLGDWYRNVSLLTRKDPEWAFFSQAGVLIIE